jgi:hypothetical protein
MIEILAYEKANKNKVIGYVDIKIIVSGLSMIIRKIAHFQNGSQEWFSLPVFSKGEFGQPLNYFKYWQFETEAHNNQLLESIRDKVKDFCQKNGIQATPALKFDEQVQVAVDAELPF